ncbi:hypothetical protein ABH920_001363 [Catenulispora sp. EB89]
MSALSPPPAPTPEETQLTEQRATRSDKLPTMTVQALFDILLVLVALAVVWFASFTVLRLFKGQN